MAASVPVARARRFPLGDSINQHGPDGELDCDTGLPPFVPDGHSFWEIGASLDARGKASDDYRELTRETPEEVRRQASFVFVTPHSGRRGWEHTWAREGQLDWLKRKNAERKWKGVQVIDGTRIVDWLRHFPAVERWLASQMNIPIPHITTPDLYWAERKRIGEPPPLSSEVFLVGRDEARQRLKDVLSMSSPELRIESHSLQDVIDFVSAHVAGLPEHERLAILGRCLIVTDEDGWIWRSQLPPRHVLVAGFPLEEDTGTTLLLNARTRGHVIIYGGPPGGIPHPNRAPLPSPRPHQLQAALEKSGYGSERARTFAHRAGSLGSLLRLLLNASIHPQWASSTSAADLAIAKFLGSWQEDREADKAAAELLAGKPYGEWIARIRDVASRSDTPLIHRHGAEALVALEGLQAPRRESSTSSLIGSIASRS